MVGQGPSHSSPALVGDTLEKSGSWLTGVLVLAQKGPLLCSHFSIWKQGGDSNSFSLVRSVNAQRVNTWHGLESCHQHHYLPSVFGYQALCVTWCPQLRNGTVKYYSHNRCYKEVLDITEVKSDLKSPHKHQVQRSRTEGETRLNSLCEWDTTLTANPDEDRT